MKSVANCLGLVKRGRNEFWDELSMRRSAAIAIQVKNTEKIKKNLWVRVGSLSAEIQNRIV